MRRNALEPAVAVLTVAIVATLLVGCSQLAPAASGGTTIGGPATSPSPSSGPQSPSTATPGGALSPAPSAASSNAGSGCFDPSTPREPVAFTNPDGPSGGEPPDGYEFMTVAQSLPTFAGIWVNQFRDEVHIALTCDVDGAIAKFGELVPREKTVLFHLVEHTHAELRSIVDSVFEDHDEWMADGIYLGSGSVDEKRNLVEIGIDPLTPAIVDEMTRRYGEPIEFVHLERPFHLPSPWPTEPETLVAVRAPAEGERLVECGGLRFLASLFDAEGEDVPADLAEDLRAAATFWTTEFPNLGELTWRLVERNDDSAAFLARDAHGDGWIYLGLQHDGQGWTPSGVGGCEPGAALEDTGVAHWVLDPVFASPGPEATELHILITERACASGQPAFGRMSPPVVIYTPDELILTAGVRPVGGAATCPSNPVTPATVILPEPLGDRVLLDGGRHPPAPPTPDY